MNLAEFAEKARPQTGPPCWLCGIPQAAEVNAALRGGTSKSVILAWLQQECGYKQATRHRIDNHARYHLG